MVLCTVVFANDIVNAVYSLIYVVQGALLIHLLFHPHVSGRQHRLELVSITSILCTLFVSLYLIEQSNSPAVEGISIVLLIVHSFVILFFGFFIIRGLIRRYNSDFCNFFKFN